MNKIFLEKNTIINGKIIPSGLFIKIIEDSSLSPEEKTVFEDIKAEGSGGLLRVFMDKEEIMIANKLVKRGLVYKGIADIKQKNIAYFV